MQATACSSSAVNSLGLEPTLLTEETLTEDTLIEDTLSEDILTEFITEEIYLEEIVLAEDQITELLLEEETIDEVYFCTSIYVPQENIEEFAKNSQTSKIFGDDIDMTSLLTKVSIGTGVIVTVVILSKVGLSGKIGSIVASAAKYAPEFAKVGAGMGTLYGGITGAADAIDESGRTAAIAKFACTTVALILTAIGLTTATGGVDLVFAGIAFGVSVIDTIAKGYEAIKTFQSTDCFEIDWDNIDWEAVGANAAEQAIEGAANGYMWGAIIGTVYGGAKGYEGYELYQKYGTPYSTYQQRLQQTPKDGNGGYWTGERGESTFVLDEPIELPNGQKITSVSYKNAVPDFSPYAVAEVNIPQMTNKRLGSGGNFEQANEALAQYWTKIQFDGQSWTARDVSKYVENNGLTWHEMNNMQGMQLVPTDVNGTFGHLGGVGEYNAMINNQDLGFT